MGGAAHVGGYEGLEELGACSKYLMRGVPTADLDRREKIIVNVGWDTGLYG